MGVETIVVAIPVVLCVQVHLPEVLGRDDRILIEKHDILRF